MRIVDTPYGRGQVKGRETTRKDGKRRVRLLVNILRNDWALPGWAFEDHEKSISIWLDESDTTPATRDNMVK